MSEETPFFLKAKPLWGKGLRGEMNVVCYFVCSFPKKEASSLVLTGNNFFRVFLNGSFFCYGPERAAHFHSKVESHALPPLQEKNRLVIEVSSSYCKSFYALKTAPFLEAELRNEKGEVTHATGLDFCLYRNTSRYQKVARYSYQRAFSESYHLNAQEQAFLKEDNGAYPKLEPFEVEEPTLEKRTLPEASYREVLFTPFEGGSFRKDPSLPIHDDRYFHDTALGLFERKDFDLDPDAILSQLVYTKTSGFSTSLKTGQFITYQSEENPAGFLTLSVQVRKKAKLVLLFDEYDCGKNPSGACDLVFYRNTVENFVTYDLAEGRYDLLSFEPYDAKYIRVLFLEGEGEVLKVGMKAYETKANPHFSFHSAEDKLNTLLLAARRSYLENSVDLLMDCPSRERAGWLFDSGFTAKAEFLFEGNNDREMAFLRNFTQFDQSQVETGMMPMCYPADFTSKNVSFIHQWSLWYILELLANYQRNGDPSILKESKANVLAILSFFAAHENKDGLLENLPYNNYIEAGEANDPRRYEGVNFPTAMLYEAALEAAQSLYPELALSSKAKRLKETVNRYGYQGGFYLDNALVKEGHYQATAYHSEVAQYYAFYFGFATPESRPELWATLLQDFGPLRNPEKTYPSFPKSNMLPGIFLRLMILNEYAKPEQVVKEALEYCYADAALTGSLWENDTPSSSLNHGFASILAPILMEPLFGLKNIDKPKKEIVFLPFFLEKEGSVSIPVGKDVLQIVIHQGQRTLVLPKGYTLKNIDR